MKQKRKFELSAGIIYQIDCNDCNKAYIGETGKTLEGRFNQL